MSVSWPPALEAMGSQLAAGTPQEGHRGHSLGHSPGEEGPHPPGDHHGSHTSLSVWLQDIAQSGEEPADHGESWGDQAAMSAPNGNPWRQRGVNSICNSDSH